MQVTEQGQRQATERMAAELAKMLGRPVRIEGTLLKFMVYPDDDTSSDLARWVALPAVHAPTEFSYNTRLYATW